MRPPHVRAKGRADAGPPMLASTLGTKRNTHEIVTPELQRSHRTRLASLVNMKISPSYNMSKYVAGAGALFALHELPTKASAPT